MELFQMSLSASVLILAIILIRACTLHLLPKRTFLVLWAVAALRLLVPYSFSTGMSIFSLLSIPNTPNLSETLQVITASQVSTGTSVSLPAISVTPSPAVSSTDAAFTTGLSSYTIIWLIGFTVFSLFFLLLHWKNRREFNTSLPVSHAKADRWLQDHPLRRTLRIRCLDRIAVPLTYGIIRPVILLPKDVPLEDDEQLQYILLHEYVHIRRLDAVWKAFLAVLLCIHWFNPLVWCMYVLANRDIELSCDEAVVHILGQEKKENYALTLIDLASTCSSAPLINHFSKNVMEERIKSIMKTKKIRLMSIILAVLLVAGVGIVFATSAKEPEKENEPRKTIVTPLEALEEAMDLNQERVLESRTKYQAFNNYYTSLQDVTSYLSVPIEELPEDIRAQIASLKNEGEAYQIEETRNMESMRQMSRSLIQRELDIFTKTIPDYVSEKKVSQSFADETQNTLSDLVYNYKINQPAAFGQLPDYIKVSIAHSSDDYLIYKLSLISDIDNSIYHDFYFTYVNPPEDN